MPSVPLHPMPLTPLRQSVDPLVVDLAQGYVTDFEQELSQVQQWIDAGDKARLVHWRHRVQGAAGSFGLQELLPAVRQLVDAASAGDTAAAHALLASIRASVGAMDRT